MELLSSAWQNILVEPLLNILVLLYGLLGNSLGLAVIVLALIIRIALLPLTKSQTNMQKKMADMRPKLQEIQTKFKDKPDELAKEQIKLYKDSGYNPVGCLGTFLPQMLVLIAIFGIIRKITDGSIDSLYPFVKEFVFGSSEAVITNDGLRFLGMNLSKLYTTLAADKGYFHPTLVVYLVMAALVGLSQYFMTKFTQIMNGQAKGAEKKNIDGKEDQQMSQEEMQEALTRSMTTVFPVMTTLFTLNTPAVLGVYWLAQSFASILQYFIIDYKASVNAMKQVLKIGSIENVVLDSETKTSNEVNQSRIKDAEFEVISKKDKKKAKKKRKNRK